MSSSSFATRKPVTVERSIGGKTVSIESGRLAKQASGAVVVRVGDTMTLVATVSGPGREGLDFFPLTVDYREKVYAAGKFPGGFIKREGRPTTKEILSSRLIDRPIRPLFPEGFRDEVQIQAGPISADRENDADVLSIIGASASLILSKVPFMGPIGAVRLGRVDDKYVALPTASEMKDSDLDMIVASTDKTIVMIEGFGRELPEAEMYDAIMEAHRLNQDVLALQHDLLAALGLPPYEKIEPPHDPLKGLLHDRFGREIREAKTIHGKQERNETVKAILKRVVAEFAPADGSGLVTALQVKTAFHAVEEKVVRELILDGHRSDGRGPRDLRPISCEVSLLPRAHGSAIFQRGETQALVTTVLGTGADAQRVDGIMPEYSKTFSLDYNIAELRCRRGPARSGGLAVARSATGPWPSGRSSPVLPDSSVFPYTIRVISDILESNGSSSMASVCGATLSLMDAGVPISDPVGGISIGLVEDPGLEPACPSDRYHRRRGPLRRHGLQGRRDPARCDGHPTRPQEPGDHRRTSSRRPSTRPARPGSKSCGRCSGRSSGLARRSRPTPLDLIQIQINPDKIGLVIGPWRQDDPSPSGRDRRQDRHRGQRDRDPRQPDGRGCRGRSRQDPGDDRRRSGRPHLRRPGHLDQGLRRLRRDPARQGRPGPHQRAVRRLCWFRDRHLPGGRPDAGQGDRRR